MPPLPKERKRNAGVWGLMMIIGVIFPLVGLSLIVMGLLDWLWIRATHKRGDDLQEASA